MYKSGQTRACLWVVQSVISERAQVHKVQVASGGRAVAARARASLCHVARPVRVRVCARVFHPTTTLLIIHAQPSLHMATTEGDTDAQAATAAPQTAGIPVPASLWTPPTELQGRLVLPDCEAAGCLPRPRTHPLTRAHSIHRTRGCSRYARQGLGSNPVSWRSIRTHAAVADVQNGHLHLPPRWQVSSSCPRQHSPADDARPTTPAPLVARFARAQTPRARTRLAPGPRA